MPVIVSEAATAIQPTATETPTEPWSAPRFTGHVG